MHVLMTRVANATRVINAPDKNGSQSFKKKKLVAHREGRTRSLQIIHPLKSLTLYPIELGGR